MHKFRMCVCVCVPEPCDLRRPNDSISFDMACWFRRRPPSTPSRNRNFCRNRCKDCGLDRDKSKCKRCSCCGLQVWYVAFGCMCARMLRCEGVHVPDTSQVVLIVTGVDKVSGAQGSFGVSCLARIAPVRFTGTGITPTRNLTENVLYYPCVFVRRHPKPAFAVHLSAPGGPSSG